MTISVAGRNLRTIAVIDDDPVVRTSYSEALEDLKVKPIDISGPLGSLENLFDKLVKDCDAIMTDLVLRGSGYSSYDGGEIAVEASRRKIPVVMCTAYADVNRKLPRNQRRRVPAVLPRASFDETLLINGYTKCIGEINGHFSPDRRPWRTQLQVVDFDDDRNYLWVMIMGRSPDERVGVSADELPKEVQPTIKIGSIYHAKVNTGAVSADDIFFDEWEAK